MVNFANFLKENGINLDVLASGRHSYKNSLKGVYRKIRRNLGKIGIAIYEGMLAKYLYDLNSVFKNPAVQATVWRGKLPVDVSLFPWPYPPYNPPPIEPPEPPSLILTRPMSSIEYAVKFFYDNPILQGIAFAAPFILLGIYYGVKRWRRNEK